jgi:type VI secretion system protein ImpH
MASPDRMSSDDLKFLRMLEEEPYRADFFAAMRAVECMNASRHRLGRSLRPADDPIRIGQHVSLEFASAALAAFTPGLNGGPSRLLVNFLGLLGPNGPMPIHITEYIHDRQIHYDDQTMAAFLDIFHHRMLSLFYRAWADSEPTVSLDRPESDRFSHYIASMIGLGLRSLRNRDDMPDQAKLHFSGWFVGQTRSADGLTAILADFFESPVKVEEFVGDWLPLPTQSLSRLGTSRENASLGINTLIGDRVWDYQNSFRLVLGPVGIDLYQRLLPGCESLKRLVAIVRNYVGDELAWELKLILKKQEIPEFRLGRQGRLGWTAWLHQRPPTKDADNLVLKPKVAYAVR